MRLRRNPNLVVYWRGSLLVIERFGPSFRVRATPAILELLDAFGRPTRPRQVAEWVSWGRSPAVTRAIRDLFNLGFLVPASPRAGTRDLAAAWRGSFAAAFYHFATTNVSYATRPDELKSYISRVMSSPQPPRYKRYRGSPRISLQAYDWRSNSTTLAEALTWRRTVRAFRRQRVPFQTFAHVISGTWGQTGSHEAGVLGQLVAKTSPSAGARHPVECYVIAWSVDSLAAGIFHFDVRRNALERLRDGNFRSRVSALLADQEWVQKSAFICVMTVVADRVFWKYRSSDAYRLFFLDAGHLAQTFALLSAASGLGAFTTAAFSEKRIEALLGIDGVREFPVYVCGAGVVDDPSSASIGRCRGLRSAGVRRH